MHANFLSLLWALWSVLNICKVLTTWFSFSGQSNKVSTVMTPAYQEQKVNVLSPSNVPADVNVDARHTLWSKASTVLNPISTSGKYPQEDRGDFSYVNIHLQIEINSWQIPEIACTWFCIWPYLCKASNWLRCKLFHEFLGKIDRWSSDALRSS